MPAAPDFIFRYTDQGLNSLLKTETGPLRGFTRHFNQAEEFFLRLDSPIEVPSLDIHHPYDQFEPTPVYQERVLAFLTQLRPRLPGVLDHLTWFFDPRDIFRPGFLQLLNYQDRRYLYLLKIDLGMRPRGCTVTTPGSNDVTPAFSTRDLYLEAEILPLAESKQEEEGGRLFFLRHLFEQTWKGESGRGYFVTGKWIDSEITKFLSKLILPEGRKTYPFYPLRCRYNTVAASVVRLDLEGRKRALQLLDSLLGTLQPASRRIQEVLKETEFSDTLPLFSEVKASLPAGLEHKLGSFRLEASLNEFDQKEFAFHAELE